MITLHVRYIARVHYIEVLLNKIVQKESSGKQRGAGREKPVLGLTGNRLV